MDPLTPERRKQIEFDAWLSMRPEFSEVLAAYRAAFGTDTSAAAGDDPNSEFSRSLALDSEPAHDAPVEVFESELEMRLGPRRYTPEQMEQIRRATAERQPLPAEPLPFVDDAPDAALSWPAVEMVIDVIDDPPRPFPAADLGPDNSWRDDDEYRSCVYVPVASMQHDPDRLEEVEKALRHRVESAAHQGESENFLFAANCVRDTVASLRAPEQESQLQAAEADYRSLMRELTGLLGKVEERPDRTKNAQIIAKVAQLLSRAELAEAQAQRYKKALERVHVTFEGWLSDEGLEMFPEQVHGALRSVRDELAEMASSGGERRP